MSATPRIKKSILAVALAVTPWFADAASLGRLNVLSGLGQPLRGEIELVSVQPEEAESLSVSLASADAHAVAGLAYPSSSLGVRLALDRRSNGSVVVLVTSAQSVNEPIFDMVVDLRSASGQIRRGYSALLDPVGYAAPSPAPAAKSEAAAPVHQESAAVAPVGKVNAAPLVQTPASSSKKSAKSGKKTSKSASSETASPFAEPTASAQAASSAASASAESTYTVKTGDTLSSIGRKVKPEGVNLDQVLVGLYRNNTAAFDGNMNLLKKGKILKVPDTQSMQSISKGEAAKEIVAQAENWHSYRKQLGEAVKKSPAEKAESGASTGKLTAKVEDKGATSADKSQDVLKLSSGKGKSGLSAEQARVKALEEEVAARKKALDEANQRVTELQKNVHKMEELAAIKSQAGAELQQKAAASAVATPVPTIAPVVASAVGASAVVASEVASAPAVKPKRVAPPVVEPEAEPSFFDSLMENLPLVGGGLLVVLGGIGAFIWNRRRQQPASFENSIITGGDLRPNTVIGRTGGGVISTQAENSFLTDFSRQGFGSIDTDEVDPIAEADVYMAYGRDAQAEEILKDALSKDRMRHEVRVKLLDIYAARKDKVAFEEVASELYAMTEGQGPHWAHAAHLGRSLDSDNPLYGRDASAGSVSATAPVAAAAAVASVAAVATEVDTDLDFDLGLDSVAPVAAEPPLVDLSLNLSSPEERSPVVVPEMSALTDDSLSVDLDFDLNVPQEEVAASSDGLMSLDLPIDVGQDEASVANLAAEPDLGSFDLNLDLSSDLSLDEELAPQPLAAPAKEPQSVVEMSSFELPAADIEETLLDDVELDQALNLDFGFSLNETAESVPAAIVAEEEVPLGGGLTNLDLGLGDATDFAAEDPVQTKIDLARAYVEMGDAEGAREILQEAMQEGTPAQQEVARGMLATL